MWGELPGLALQFGLPIQGFQATLSTLRESCGASWIPRIARSILFNMIALSKVCCIYVIAPAQLNPVYVHAPSLVSLSITLTMRFTSAVTALAITGTSAANRLKCRDTDPNVNGPYIASTAPRENIFAPISVEESNSIKDFLQSQSNVTMFVF